MKIFYSILILGLSSLVFEMHAFAYDRPAFKQQAQYGFCKSDNQIVDMRNVLKIENDVIFSQNPKSSWSSVKLHGDKVKFIYAKGTTSGFTSIHYAINDDSIADVRLRFALHNNEVVLYWEETYENKIQKLGLMKFDVKYDSELDWTEPEFIDICRGSKGVKSSH